MQVRHVTPYQKLYICPKILLLLLNNYQKKWKYHEWLTEADLHWIHQVKIQIVLEKLDCRLRRFLKCDKIWYVQKPCWKSKEEKLGNNFWSFVCHLFLNTGAMFPISQLPGNIPYLWVIVEYCKNRFNYSATRHFQH